MSFKFRSVFWFFYVYNFGILRFYRNFKVREFRSVFCLLIFLFVVCFYVALCEKEALINSSPQISSRFKKSTVEEAQPITVVTAYYHIPSKSSHAKYMQRAKNFLSRIPCNLYIFTEKASFDDLYEFRKSHLNRTRWVIKEFDELRLAQNRQVWEGQRKLDHENYHTSQLYIMWHEKPNFVLEAINENFFGSEYFIWCDIGSFRNTNHLRFIASFPDQSRTNVVLHDHQKMSLLLVEDFEYPNDFIMGEDGLPIQTFQKVIRIGATVLAGHIDAWKRWDKVYYSTLQRFLETGRFAGKDQNLMAAIAVMYPEYVNLVKQTPYFQKVGNPWYFFHYYFSKLCHLNNTVKINKLL